jgi:excisionase family DNA binding protein
MDAETDIAPQASSAAPELNYAKKLIYNEGGTMAPIKDHRVASLEPLQTPEEAASYLRVHPKTVIRMARTLVIPALRLGKHWRFRSSDLTAWTASQVKSACQPGE